MKYQSCQWLSASDNSPKRLAMILLFSALLASSALAPRVALADEANAGESTGEKTAGTDSLDDELLKGLGSEDEVEVGDPAAAGEDAAPADADDPLIRLSQKMRSVESRIAEQKSDTETQDAQQGIVSELDKLIAAAQKQCKKCAGACSGKPGSSQAGKPGKSGGNPGAQSATDSSKALKNRTVRRPEMGEMDELMKKVWGHLPEQMQKQMVQGPAEVFLPKYELMIEEYFRSLADEKASNP